MAKYILKRILMSILAVFIIASITFALSKAIPGGPFSREKPLAPEIIENLNRRYQLDKPVWDQYVSYMGRVATFDFGPSFYYRNDTVNDIIYRGFPVSALLGVSAMIVAIVLGIPFGIISALKQNKWQDNLLKIITTLFVSLPSFVIASLLMYVLAYKLKLLPAALWGTPAHMVMPVLALSAYPLAYITKLMKSSMLEVMNNDYMRTAKAKGLKKFSILYVHALKNAILPVVTVMGPMLASIMTGSLVVEKIFAVPGLGQDFTSAIFNRDYTMIMGVTVFYAILLIGCVLVVDICYGFVDPRIKVNGGK